MNPYAVGGASALGAIGGAYSGYQENKGNRRALSQLINDQEAMNQQIGILSADRIAQLGQQSAPLTAGMGDTISRYYGALGSSDYGKYDVSAPSEFSFDLAGETQAQLNPALEAIIARSNDAVQQSAANAGSLFSGATGKAIARSTADIQAKEWGAAAQRAQQQQQNKYQQYMDRFNNALKTTEFNRSNTSMNIGNLGKMFEAQTGAYGEQLNAQNQVQNAADTARLQGQQAINQANYERAKLPSGFAAGLSGGLSGLSSAVGAFGGGQ
jgi:hypothetical protein